MNWAVVVAALITLVGGALVYRWQKETDRLSEIAKERREAYRNFIDALDAYMLMFWSSDEQEQMVGQSDFRRAKRKVVLVASSWVLEAIEEHAVALQNCRKVMSNKQPGTMEEVLEAIRKSEDRIIVEMRNDFYFGIGVELVDVLPLPRKRRQ